MAQNPLCVAALMLLGLTSHVFAAEEHYCQSTGELASGMVHDRDRGTSYGETLAAIKVMTKNYPDVSASVRRQVGGDMRTTARYVYIDMPKLTPEGASKFIQMLCEIGKLK